MMDHKLFTRDKCLKTLTVASYSNRMGTKFTKQRVHSLNYIPATVLFM